MGRLLRHPSAFAPLAMSAIVLSMMAVHLARFGPAPQPDEGTGAHVFQILMPMQLPVIAFFAIAWIPRDRVHALQVLALQVTAAIVPFAIVFALRW